MQVQSEQWLEKQHMAPRKQPWLWGLCRDSDSPSLAGWLPAWEWKVEPVQRLRCKPRAIQWKSHCFWVRQQEEKPGRAPRVRKARQTFWILNYAPQENYSGKNHQFSSRLSVLQHLDQKAASGILSSKGTPGQLALQTTNTTNPARQSSSRYSNHIAHLRLTFRPCQLARGQNDLKVSDVKQLLFFFLRRGTAEGWHSGVCVTACTFAAAVSKARHQVSAMIPPSNWLCMMIVFCSYKLNGQSWM